MTALLADSLGGSASSYPLTVSLLRARRRQTCKGPCGRDLPLTRRFFYVNGKQSDGSPKFRLTCKACFNEGRKPSTPAQIEVARRYNREMRRLYRQDPEKRERMRAADRRSKAKRQQRGSSASERAIERAEDRMWYRLRRERDGHVPAPSDPVVGSNNARLDGHEFPRLPAAPLASAILALIRRTALDCVYAVDVSSGIRGEAGDTQPPERHHREGALSPREAVCERLGVASRNLYDWEHGVRPTVAFDTADRVLTRAGWLWWDVWADGEGYSLARFAFEGESDAA